uniref:Uncharacterized protein n=1 Tax=Kalanchoe fedtschenkoi TaxID=63787 RepID=A0A7N0V1K2_KALFE
MVTLFCKKHGIEVSDMNDYYVPHGRARCFFKKVKNYIIRVVMFLIIIDLQLLELNNQFNEVNVELLTSMTSLNPANSFVVFDKRKILKLVKFYSNDFTVADLMKIHFQLQNYINDLRNDVRFQQVKDLSCLSLYLLQNLILILTVATTSVGRMFSELNFVKNKK